MNQPSGSMGLWDDERTAAAVAVANIPTLLMVLVHLTGETRWIERPFLPSPPRGMGDNDTGGLSEELQIEVRATATEAIFKWTAGSDPALPMPSDEMLVRMLSASVGESVPAEWGPMLAAELAQVTGPPPKPAAEREGLDLNALVIGGGISGVCAAVRLKEAGIPFTVLEKQGSLGGVWRDNRYPAAAVDTPSHLYSYSFTRHDWPRYFATRDQVDAYVSQVAADFNLNPHILFGTEVLSATYDEPAQGWVVEVRWPDGVIGRLKARILISAVGVFNHPTVPDIKGVERFVGKSFHSTEWPEGLEVAGKRVAVVGNGATAMQMVPALAALDTSLTVFQRSTHWVAPFEKFQKDVPDDVRYLLQQVPLYYGWYRMRLAWIFNDKLHAMLEKDPSWPHPDRSMNKANDRYRQFLTDYIVSELGDRQDLLPQVLPNYPPLGKRLLLDNGWYRTLRRDNVRLVTDGIAEMTEGGIVTESGEEYPQDVIVFATGFDVVRMLTTMEVHGRFGASLREEWGDDDAKAFLGLAAPNFPNLFILYGPNTQTGHGGSLIGSVEAQMHYIVGILDEMRTRGLGSVEVKPEVFEAYNDRVDAAHENMVWTHPGMDTYYRNSRGRVVVPSPYRVVDFWHLTHDVDIEAFDVEPLCDFPPTGFFMTEDPGWSTP